MTEHIAHAEPQKSYFIYMLTRDIGVLECILDLIDNSIHNLIKRENLNVMEMLLDGKKITIGGSQLMTSLEVIFY